MSIVE
jgi:hypothetical protein